MNWKKFGIKLMAAVSLFSNIGLVGTSVVNAEDKKPIIIGANYELSGYSASYGQGMLNALELAVEEVNEAGGLLGGRPVEIINIDNKSDKTETATVASRLASDGACAIIGPSATDTALAQNPVVTKEKIPTIIPAATADTLTFDENGNVLDYVFRLAFSYTYQANACARFAKDELKGKKAVVIVDQSNDYSVGQAEPFKKEWKRLGGEIVAEESYVAGETDFSVFLTSLASKDFDVIHLPAFYTEGGLIVKQARELGITQPILSGHGFSSDEFVNLAEPQNATDIYYISNFYLGTDDKDGQTFIKNYEKKFKKKPDSIAALGYDGAKLLFKAIETAGTDDREAIRDAIENMKNYEGITGSLEFDDKHNAIRSAPMLHMVNGEVKDIYEVDGSEHE